MGSAFSTDSQQIRAAAFLLRGHFQYRTALKYQINSYIISNNYQKSNPSPKYEQEFIKLSKVLLKKLDMLVQNTQKLREKSKKKQHSSGLMENLSRLLLYDQNMNSQYEDPVEVVEQEDLEVKELKARKEMMDERLKGLREVFMINSEFIDEGTRKTAKLTELKTEIEDLRHYKKYKNSNIRLIKRKKSTINEAININKRRTTMRIEALPYNILSLYSKLIKKKELSQRLEQMNRAIQKKEKELIAEGNGVTKMLGMAENENIPISNDELRLETLMKVIKLNEYRLEYWKQEKDNLKKSLTKVDNSLESESISDTYTPEGGFDDSPFGLSEGFTGIHLTKIELDQEKPLDINISPRNGKKIHS